MKQFFVFNNVVGVNRDYIESFESKPVVSSIGERAEISVRTRSGYVTKVLVVPETFEQFIAWINEEKPVT